jgi:hypothetical protein
MRDTVSRVLNSVKEAHGRRATFVHLGEMKAMQGDVRGHVRGEGGSSRAKEGKARSDNEETAKAVNVGGVETVWRRHISAQTLIRRE